MSKILQALEIVKKAKADINKLFNDPQHIQSLLEINSNFQRLETKLEFMSSVLSPAKKDSSAKKLFPPLKSFMGQKLSVNQPLKQEDLTPSESRKKDFIGKVDKLWNEIGNFTSDTILQNYRIDRDIMIIRGVAKRAGVEDYESRVLDVPFIEEIQMAVELKKEELEKQEEIDDATKQTSEPQVLTEEDIAADPELQKLNAKPGDTLIIKKGKKKVVPAAPPK
jgi:hypothetical protein